jgi:type II secretory pathway pseudopilin PulG
MRVPGRVADEGSSLVEATVALAVIAVVMASSAPFFVQSIVSVAASRDRQAAVRLADEAMERARAIKSSAVLSGRGRLRSTAQWAAAPAAAQALLAGLTLDWDPDVLLPANAGDAAPLPTSPRAFMVNRVPYALTFYVGRCRQQGGSGTAERPCERSDLADPAPLRQDVAMFEVVITVTWPHNSCASRSCIYVTSMLISGGNDPVFTIRVGS